MYTVTITFSPEKSKVWKKCSKIEKNPNFKFKKSTEIRVFNFFSFFLLQNHFIMPLCWSKKISCFYLVSFYFIFINPQKTPNSRENRGNLEIRSTEYFFIIIFVISVIKSLRKVRSRLWRFPVTYFCWPKTSRITRLHGEIFLFNSIV